MSSIQHLSGVIRRRFRRSRLTVAKQTAVWLGYRWLTNPQTHAYLRPHRIAHYADQQLLLPDVANPAKSAEVLRPATVAATEPVMVWQFAPPAGVLLPSGAILTGQQVLSTDFDNVDSYGDLYVARPRTAVAVDTLLAPWSHYVDGIAYGGYYDFVVLVAAKLCRMRNALPAGVFESATVAYPLFNTAYEREFLALLGITPSQVYDSQLYNVAFRQCVLGNSGHWFYPNAADMLALRRYVTSRMVNLPSQQNRIYVQRAGRRRIVNEAELIDLLRQYDFEVIADQPRSVAEQYEIYRNASCIIGPHGASFTNILWCEPDTLLFELFSPHYVTDHFRYLAQLLGLRYVAYHDGPPLADNTHRLTEDIYVSIPAIARSLERLLVHV